MLKNTNLTDKMSIASFLQVMVGTLQVAVNIGLMKREHAGAIWKELLKENDIDIPKPEKGVKKNDITEKDKS